MRGIDPSGVPAGEFKSATAGFLVHPEEANRLVKAFLRISSPDAAMRSLNSLRTWREWRMLRRRRRRRID